MINISSKLIAQSLDGKAPTILFIKKSPSPGDNPQPQNVGDFNDVDLNSSNLKSQSLRIYDPDEDYPTNHIQDSEDIQTNTHVEGNILPLDLIVPIETKQAEKVPDSVLEVPTAFDEVILEVSSLSKEMAETISRIREEAQQKLLYLRLFLLTNLFANILGLLMFFRIITPFSLLIIISIIPTSLLVLTLIRKRDKTVKVQKFFQIAHLTCIIIYIVFLLLKLKSLISTIIPGFVPGPAIAIIEFFIFGHKKIQLFESKWLLWIQLILIGLKMSNIQLEWPITLCLLYFLFLLTFFWRIYVFISWVMVHFGFSYLKTKEKAAVIGSTWTFLILLSILPWELVVALLENLFPIVSTIQDLWYLFATNAIYCVSLCLLTLCFKNQLLSFLKEYAFLNRLGMNEAKLLEDIKVFKLAKIDKVCFTKVSSTYYRTVSIQKPLTNPKLNRKSCKTDKVEHSAFKCIKESFPTLEDNQTKEVKQENLDCQVCFERKAEVVIMECGHGGLCCVCAAKQWKDSSKCYICRRNVTSILKIDYLSDSRIFQATKRLILVEEKRQIVL